MIIQNLKDALMAKLSQADEVHIAVALVNDAGSSFIINAVKETCTVSILAGVDLPTEPSALSKLVAAGFSTRVYGANNTYHPKAYIIRQGNEWNAFIGSANLTLGGLINNVGISAQIDDPASCETLMRWYRSLADGGINVTEDFIESYQLLFARRRMVAELQRAAAIESQNLIDGYRAKQIQKNKSSKATDQQVDYLTSIIDLDSIKRDPVKGFQMLNTLAFAKKLYWKEPRFVIDSVAVSFWRSRKEPRIYFKTPMELQQFLLTNDSNLGKFEYKFFPSALDNGHVNIGVYGSHNI